MTERSKGRLPVSWAALAPCALVTVIAVLCGLWGGLGAAVAVVLGGAAVALALVLLLAFGIVRWGLF